VRRRDLWRKGSVRNGLIDGQSKNTGIESRDVDTLIAQLGGDKHRQELRRLLWSESNGGASRCAGSILRYYPVCVCVVFGFFWCVKTVIIVTSWRDKMKPREYV